MSYIKGNFKKYIYRGDKGFVIGLFKIRQTDLNIKNTTITFTGYFKELNETDLYLLTGSLENHPKYGEQFSTASYEVVLPEDKDHIIDFLSSDIFKGIGEKKATKIVETLGPNCLSLILEEKQVLSEVKGLTSKQIETIYESLLTYKTSYEKMLTLTKLGFTMKDALKIEKYYGNNTDLILTSPYQMINEIKEITFPKIEKLRTKLNISLDDIERISFGLIYAMENISFQTGNTYTTYQELVNYSAKLLSVKETDITKGITNLVNLNKLIIDGDKYILMDSFQSEVYISKRIAMLTRDFDKKSYDENIEDISEKLNIIFNKEQKKAINTALRFNFSVISGGPGTGKTTIIKAITNIYQDVFDLTGKQLLNDLALLAPTGRASKRMSLNTHLPSYTIHRFLKWQKEDDSFLVSEENKSDAKLVIIDEASMLDSNLFYNLLLGLKPNCKIVLIGDYNQLPPVGKGQILKDIIESDCVPVVYLTKLYRQSENSNINFLARDIIEGKANFSLFNESDDLTFVPCGENDLKEKLEEFMITYKDLSISSLQVLAPLYRGKNGIDSLNMNLQELLNPKTMKTKEFIHNATLYRENDKIIQLVNDVEQNVFNGDIGTVKEVNTKKKEITCAFDENKVTYSKQNLEKFKLGYVISIHKSQGSEFKVVILPVLNSYNYMLYKKLIYTAVTRAKEKLIILGEKTAFERAIKTDRDENRKTLLKDFLIDSITFSNSGNTNYEVMKLE